MKRQVQEPWKDVACQLYNRFIQQESAGLPICVPIVKAHSFCATQVSPGATIDICRALALLLGCEKNLYVVITKHYWTPLCCIFLQHHSSCFLQLNTYTMPYPQWCEHVNEMEGGQYKEELSKIIPSSQDLLKSILTANKSPLLSSISASLIA